MSAFESTHRIESGMGLFDFFKNLLPGKRQLRKASSRKASGLGVDELARRLGLMEEDLRSVTPDYREFSIPKRSGGSRRIRAPQPKLKAVQRRILRRLLARLTSHPAATGFERGRSIVTNAMRHSGKAVVLVMDLKDFFDSTAAERVKDYFYSIGWSEEATGLLVALCTDKGSLPQGAPTSPKLSNLVNYRMDARLAALAAGWPLTCSPRTGERLDAAAVPGATYTRYADDLAFSFATDIPAAIRAMIHRVKEIVADEECQIHKRRKLKIRRRHTRQIVTGLVVNEGVRLPRATRRWLRAVEHRLATGRAATLDSAQVAGWRALQAMVARQTKTR